MISDIKTCECVMTIRLGNLKDAVKDKAAMLGISQSEYIRRLVEKDINKPLDLSEVEEVRGNLADGMMTMGESYVTEGILGRKTTYIVAEGYLWLQKRTLNWSARYLTKVCRIPSAVVDTVGRHRGDIVKQLIVTESALKYFIRACNLIGQCEDLEWYRGLTAREQQALFTALEWDDTVDTLTSVYAPTTPVEKETVTVGPLPKKMKAQQLIDRFQLRDVWQRIAERCKVEGFTTPCGAVYQHHRSSNYWVLC